MPERVVVRENLYKSPVARIDADVRGFVQAQQSELGVGKQKVWVKPKENEQRVYIIREADDSAGSYVGWTPLSMQTRLDKHNENGYYRQGAVETRGKQWKVALVLKGFNDQQHATSFESAMQQEYNEVSCWKERIEVAKIVMKLLDYQFVHIDPDPLREDKVKKKGMKKDLTWQGQRKAAEARRAASNSSTSTSASSGLPLSILD